MDGFAKLGLTKGIAILHFQVRKELNSLYIDAFVLWVTLQFCLSTCFSKVTVESNFAELVDFSGF